MPHIPLVLLLALSSVASAAKGGRAKAAHATVAETPPEGSIWDIIEAGEEAPTGDSTGEAKDAAAPAIGTATDADAFPQPAEGSLWTYIENGDLAPEPPSAEELVESRELSEARRTEEGFITRVRVNPPVDFYQNPVKALEHDPLYLDKVNVAEFDIPIDINEDVIRWMNYFTGKGRKYYTRWMGRSSTYRPMMYEKLRAAGLPEDLVYLSMVESGYSTSAYSSAAAAGLWQFIASTGKMYDLRIDSWVDERRDPEASTDAAVHLLSDLYKQFGDWRLVWAAYNGGPGRVTRGQARHGTKDFWKLVEKNAFASETDNYVPKIMAAAIIGKHPERYGFTGIDYQPALDRDTIRIKEGMYGLDVLAEAAGMSVEDLRNLNPHIRQMAIPPEGTFIHVPNGKGERFAANVAAIPPEKRLTFREHKVGRGETLGTIAKKYNVSVSDLQAANHIKNPNLISVGQKLVIPGAGAPARALAASTAPSPDPRVEEKSSAEKTSTAKTSTAKTSTPSKSASSKALVSSAGSGSAPPKTTLSWHTIQRGETLSSIASKNGVSSSDLMRWNGISNANHIQAGQKLKVYTPASAWTTHTVRAGESLSSIASKYGCTVGELQQWNKISGTRINAGQKLKIRER